MAPGLDDNNAAFPSTPVAHPLSSQEARALGRHPWRRLPAAIPAAPPLCQLLQSPRPIGFAVAVCSLLRLHHPSRSSGGCLIYLPPPADRIRPRYVFGRRRRWLDPAPDSHGHHCGRGTRVSLWRSLSFIVVVLQFLLREWWKIVWWNRRAVYHIVNRDDGGANGVAVAVASARRRNGRNGRRVLLQVRVTFVLRI